MPPMKDDDTTEDILVPILDYLSEQPASAERNLAIFNLGKLTARLLHYKRQAEASAGVLS